MNTVYFSTTTVFWVPSSWNTWVEQFNTDDVDGRLMGNVMGIVFQRKLVSVEKKNNKVTLYGTF